MSCGPLPARRPPSSWHQPQTLPKKCATSASLLRLASALACGDTKPESPATPMPHASAATALLVFRKRPIPHLRGGREPKPPPLTLSRMSRASGQRVGDEITLVRRHALEWLAEYFGVVIADQRAPARGYRDVLLALRGVADNPADMADPVIVRPQLGAVAAVVGMEDASRIRHEHQIAAGGEQRGQGRLGKVDPPLHLARHRIARVHVTVSLAAGRVSKGEVGADVELVHRLGDRSGLHHLDVHAPFVADLVVKAGLRAVRPRVPGDAAVDGRAERGSLLARRQVPPTDRLAVLAYALDEVDVLDERPSVLEAEVLVEDVDVAALVRVDDVLLSILLDLQELADGVVEVPGVVRQGLEVALELAGVRVERDQ